MDNSDLRYILCLHISYSCNDAEKTLAGGGRLKFAYLSSGGGGGVFEMLPCVYLGRVGGLKLLQNWFRNRRMIPQTIELHTFIDQVLQFRKCFFIHPDISFINL